MRTKKYGKRKNKTNRHKNINRNRKMKGGFFSLFNFKQTDEQIQTQIDKLNKEKLAIDAEIQKLKEKLSTPARQNGVAGPQNGVAGPQTGITGPATALAGPQNGVAGPQTGITGPATALAGPSLNGKGPQK
jgi:hypothetical protein